MAQQTSHPGIARQVTAESVPFTKPLTLTKSLSSLPHDLLVQISSLFDLPTALSLALPAKCFVSPAHSRIWRDLNFSIGTSNHAVWIDDGFVNEEDIHLVKRLKGILSAGKGEEDEHGRWRYVKSVTLTPRAKARDGLAQLLVKASPTMGSLSVNPTSPRDTSGVDGIDIPLLHLPTFPTFPFLVKAVFGTYTLSSLDLIPLLCEASPNLISLSFATSIFSRDSIGSDVHNSDSTVPGFTRPTKLRELSILLGQKENPEVLSETKMISALLDHCPLLVSFAMPQFHTAYGNPGGRFISHLAHMKELRKLDWERPILHRNEDRKASSVLHTITSLRLTCFLFQHPMIYNTRTQPTNLGLVSLPAYTLPVLSSMEEYSFDCSGRQDIELEHDINSEACDCLQCWSSMPLSADAQPITPGLGTWLKANERLSSIYFDDSRSDSPIPLPIRQRSGAIRSILFNNGEELLHVRLLVHDIQLINLDHPSHIIHRRFPHTHAQQELDSCSGIANVSQPFYQDFTCYRGHVIDLSVLEKVKMVEGIKDEKYWDRRGVEVGDKAWAVVEAWIEDFTRE